MEDFKGPSIAFKYSKDGRHVDVLYQCIVLMKDEDNDVISCYLPGYDIYYSAKNQEMVDKKAGALTKMYFDHFVLHTKKGIKGLALELHKLGFESKNNNSTLGRIMLNQPVNAQFRSLNVFRPVDFEDAKESVYTSQIAMAV